MPPNASRRGVFPITGRWHVAHMYHVSYLPWILILRSFRSTCPSTPWVVPRMHRARRTVGNWTVPAICEGLILSPNKSSSLPDPVTLIMIPYLLIKDKIFFVYIVHLLLSVLIRVPCLLLCHPSKSLARMIHIVPCMMIYRNLVSKRTILYILVME